MSSGDATAHDDENLFALVLGEAAAALERERVPYAVFGALAEVIYGRPAEIEDIDFLVRPPDADRALEALEETGFETEKTAPEWLYKATKKSVPVDLIFRVADDIYLDDEVLAHARQGDFQGCSVRVVSAEDAVVIEAVSTDVRMPQHWYNALAIVAAQRLDWDYLATRARYGLRRVLSLLVFAQSTDVDVPDPVVRSLFCRAYEPPG